MIELFSLLLTLILLLVVFMKPILGFLKARRLHANISFGTCVLMCFRRTLTDDLIQAAAFAQKNRIAVEVPQLEAHILCERSPLNCLRAIEYAKSKDIALDFRTVSVVDLADKDLIEAIDKTAEGITLHCEQVNDGTKPLGWGSFEYQGTFSIDFRTAAFAIPNQMRLGIEVSQKVMRSLDELPKIDEVATPKFITEVLLDASFWESKRMTLVSQELRLN